MGKVHRRSKKQTSKSSRSKKRKEKYVKTLVDQKRGLRRLTGELEKSKNVDPGVPFKNDRGASSSQGSSKRNRKHKRSKQQKMANLGLAEMLRNAEIRDDVFSSMENPVETTSTNLRESKKCYKEFKKVVEAADVILEVLDARDPLGSRCPQVEQSVLNSGANKRLVLVLNKIDLIPRKNMEEWLKYLRQEFPTIAFKASTQSQNDHLSQVRVAAIHMSENLQSSRRCVGASSLMKALGNYCRNQNILTSIKVGVVGLPNVGKSSIINSLKRSRTCTVGATPGVTKNMQEIILDKHIRLLDSPGVVLSKDGNESTLALRNAVKIEKLEDVVTPAESIIKRADRAQLMVHYGIPEFQSSEEFLFHLAYKSGCFRKGGIPDVTSAARKLVNDWNSGVIKYYTHPPEVFQPSTHISAELVLEMGRAFDLASLDEKMEMEQMASEFPTDGVAFSLEEKTNIHGAKNGTAAKMETEEVGNDDKTTVQLDPKKKELNHKLLETKIPLEFKQNKMQKKAFKRFLKKRRRLEKKAVALSEIMSSVLTL